MLVFSNPGLKVGSMMYQDRREVTVKVKDKKTGKVKEGKSFQQFSFRVRASQNSWGKTEPIELKLNDENFVKKQAPQWFLTEKEWRGTNEVVPSDKVEEEEGKDKK